MKEKLLFCVLFFVTYKCDGYGSKPSGILGQILSGTQDLGSAATEVLEEISKGGVNYQGQFQANSQQGGYYRPQGPNYGGYKPQKPVDTIIVVIEESPENNQYGHGHGHYGQQEYGYRPQQNNRPNYPHRPGYNNYGGNYNNGPWNNGYGHHPPPHHHLHGPGYNPHPYYNNGNYNQNQIPNNEPNNNNNFDQNPGGNIPGPPHRPFDRPVNTDSGNPIPTDLPHKPFDRPINVDLPGIPTSLPNQGNLGQNQPSPKPDADGYIDKKPVETSSTENSLNDADKTTKDPKEDMPLFVPLNPNQYVYGGDKIEVTAPKREANEESKPAEIEDEYSHSDIDPLDVRIGDNP